MRVPHCLVGPVSGMLSEHLRSVAADRRISGKRALTKAMPTFHVPQARTVSLCGPVDATAMLTGLADQKIKAAAVVLDPMYRAKEHLNKSPG